MKQIVIKENQAGQRLDKFLAKYLQRAPKSFIYKMLRKKNIVLNGKKADGSEKLVIDDEVKLFFSDETLEKFTQSETAVLDNQNLKLKEQQIIYENEHICILNKPCGILSQKAKKDDLSMNELFVRYCQGKKTEEQYGFRPAVCNRLDCNTSGILIGGKTLPGLQQMSALLKEHSVKKYYLCLVVGQLTGSKNMKGYLKKDETNNKVSISEVYSEGASYIETVYTALSGNENFTLLKVELVTGRTHQIRSHLSSIHHPCVGDPKYGKASVNRQMQERYGLKHQLLHSYQLCFPILSHPFEDLSQMEFTAPPPKLFSEIIEREGLRYGDMVNKRA